MNPGKERVLTRAFVIGLCSYEIAAILASQRNRESRSRMPTITAICREHRLAEAAFFTWLVLHLHRDIEREARLWQLLRRKTGHGDG